MDPEKLLELMKFRRSIRSYKIEPVPDFMIDQILEAARWCQSCSNLQPWRFIVVKNKDLIEGEAYIVPKKDSIEWKRKSKQDFEEYYGKVSIGHIEQDLQIY